MLQSKTEKLRDSLVLITVLEIERRVNFLEKVQTRFSELLTYINDCQRFSLIVFMKRWYSLGPARALVGLCTPITTVRLLNLRRRFLVIKVAVKSP